MFPPMNNRLRNLLPQQIQNPGNITTPQQGVVNPLAALSGAQDATGNDTSTNLSPLARLANAPTPMMDQYKQMLSQAPDPANYQPSKTQKIMGALASLSGLSPVGIAGGQVVGARYDPQVGNAARSSITDAPYQKAMQRYELMTGLAGKGAEIEERDIANKRAIAENLEANRIREKEADLANATRADQARTAAKKEQDIHDQKQAELEEKVRKAEADLAEKQREFAGKQSNFEQQLQLHQLQLKVTDATHQLQLAQRDRALDETKRANDMKEANWKAEREQMDRRLKIMEDAAATKGGGKGTETVQTTTPTTTDGLDLGILGHWGGQKGKTVTTTKQPIQQIGTTKMRGPDGNTYNIPNDKVEDAKKNQMVVVQ